jgi:hypothetical protein
MNKRRTALGERAGRRRKDPHVRRETQAVALDTRVRSAIIRARAIPRIDRPIGCRD